MVHYGHGTLFVAETPKRRNICQAFFPTLNATCIFLVIADWKEQLLCAWLALLLGGC